MVFKCLSIRFLAFSALREAKDATHRRDHHFLCVVTYFLIYLHENATSMVAENINCPCIFRVTVSTLWSIFMVDFTLEAGEINVHLF